ncbi:MAG: hypothetical protein CME61_05575 [Halobacteriovoraceae bacterium]|nr:hypothetical protein [Halobacteriovoraceae bacterium]|tara:strand:+ start:347 stop:565 length:219 start_codon:yes stop_codon:yes gene_type:complete
MGKIIKFAKVDNKKIEKIKKLESKLGVCLVAYELSDAPDYQNLSDEEIKEIQKIEKELGVTILAYQEDKKAS